MSAPETPSTADILTAIQELRTYIDVRFTKVDADIAAAETRIRTEMAAMEARLSARIETDARVVAARLDEQRHTLNSLIRGIV